MAKKKRKARRRTAVRGSGFLREALGETKSRFERALDREMRALKPRAEALSAGMTLLKDPREAARVMADATAAYGAEERRRGPNLGFTSSGNPKRPRRAAPRLDLVPSGPLRRVAARFELGLKYGPPGTWKNDLDLVDALNHAIDHLLSHRDRLDRFRAGERPDPRREDDDLAAAAWGCIALMEYQDREGGE